MKYYTTQEYADTFGYCSMSAVSTKIRNGTLKGVWNEVDKKWLIPESEALKANVCYPFNLYKELEIDDSALVEAEDFDEALDVIDKIIDTLGDKIAHVVKRYFSEPGLTFEELGNDIGLSKQRICQMYAKGIRMLKAPIRVKALETLKVMTIGNPTVSEADIFQGVQDSINNILNNPRESGIFSSLVIKYLNSLITIRTQDKRFEDILDNMDLEYALYTVSELIDQAKEDNRFDALIGMLEVKQDVQLDDISVEFYFRHVARNVSVRCFNCVLRSSWASKTMEELWQAMNNKEELKIRNLGKRSFDELYSILNSLKSFNS